MDRVEQVIKHLEKQKISINRIIEKLEVDRGFFYSWRKSTKTKRRNEMAEKIIELFQEHFQEGWEDDQPEVSDQEKYIALLEQTVEDLRRDKERCNEIIDLLKAKK